MAALDQTSASRAVLIEIANVLGAFREQMVVIGGWVPDLLFPGRNHMGSLDVDFAVSPLAVAENAYQTIRKRLADAGYQQQSDPTRFVKTIAGVPEPVKVDLISGKEAAGGKNAIQVNELQLSCLTGVDLAFAAFDEVEVPGSMPDGTRNTVRVRIVRPEAFILIKAYALDERTKDKDAYDIAFGLSHLAVGVRTLLGKEIGKQAFAILQSKFATIDSVGPVWAARVFQEQGEDYDQALRSSYEDAQALFQYVLEEAP